MKRSHAASGSPASSGAIHGSTMAPPIDGSDIAPNPRRVNRLRSHFRSHAYPEQPRGAAVPHRDLHRPTAPHERHQLTAPHVSERARQRADLRPRNLDPDAGLDLVAGNVGHEGAEAVHVDHFAHHGRSVVTGRRERGEVRVGDGVPEVRERGAEGQLACRRREYVTCVERGRGASGNGKRHPVRIGRRNDSSPLSGATKKCPAACTARARRAVPTPGSITAKWTAPWGKRCHVRDRMYCPARTSPGGTWWLMSTSATPWTWESSTPFTSPT